MSALGSWSYKLTKLQTKQHEKQPDSDFKKVKLDVVFPEKLAPLSKDPPTPSRRDNTGSVFSAQLMEVVSIWLFPVLLI